MKWTMDENKPIFQQIAEWIEDEIVGGALPEGAQVPSTNQFAEHFQINPATAAKGIHVLVEEGLLFKKRGVGMFVSDGAKAAITVKRKERFYEQYVVALLQEAEKIEISTEDIVDMIKRGKGGGEG